MRIRVLTLTAVLILATGCSAESSPGSTAAPPNSTSPTSAAAATDEPALELTTDEAMQTVDAYFAAYDAGDIDGMVDLMTPEVRIGGEEGDDVVEEWRLMYEWTHAEEAEFLSRDCEATQGDEPHSAVVDCDFEQHQYVSRAVGGPAVPYTTTFVITPEGITEINEGFGSPDFNTVNQPFYAWMRAHHPEDADAVGCCGGDSVEDARERGALRVEYADQWAAWLDDHPDCRWNDIGCQADGS